MMFKEGISPYRLNKDGYGMSVGFSSIINSNLFGGRDLILREMYSYAMSLAVSMAAHNYDGGITQPICNGVEIISRTGFPGSCGRTYTKLFFAPASHQNL